MKLDDVVGAEKTDTDKNMSIMFNILREKKRVQLEHLILNRLSFAQTVENLFALSFIVKDGRAEIIMDKNRLHYVAPKNAPAANSVMSKEVAYTHFVFRYDFNDWKRKYKWLPEHEHDMKKAFDHKASDLYSSAMYRVRREIDPGDWIPPEMRKQLEAAWSENSWKGKSQVNTQNRISSDNPLHTGGSISTTEHFKRMKKDSNVSPTCWALFQRTHKVKGDPSKWVSSKSEMVAVSYI